MIHSSAPHIQREIKEEEGKREINSRVPHRSLLSPIYLNSSSQAFPCNLGQFRIMAEFVEDFNSLRSAMALIDMDPTLEMMNNFPELSATVLENPSLGLLCCSNDSFLSQQLELQALYVEGSSGLPPVRYPAETRPFGSPTVKDGRRTSKRKKASAEADSACAIRSVPPLENGSCAEVKAKKKSSSCKAKERCSGKGWKPGEVVHVRAKRGQATDRHSLAERVRRGKINEKIRCLQGLVPGCYKAMGMAVMLDEIIKYVQSLQNQVEFLSMKLSAASAVYDLNLDLLDAAAVMPQLLPRVDDADDARGANSLMTGGYEGCSSFQPF